MIVRPSRASRSSSHKLRSVESVKEGLGISFPLLLVWLWFEFGRPANPLGIPFLISAVLIVGWIFNKEKRWSTQSALLVAFILAMAAGVPLATNTYAAFWSTYAMATTLLCICLPLPSMVTSVRKVRLWIYTFVAVSAYVGGWALFNGGYGPAGSGGGQDENYVAAMMGMAISFAYFSIFGEKRRVLKALLGLMIPLFLGATLAAGNVSRGGFLGLCAVFLYALARSPQRWKGLVVIVLIIVAVLPFAPPEYWDAISSIQDVTEGTADLRLEIWAIGVRMWQAHPVLGVGAGNFRWMVGEYQYADQRDKYGRDLGGSIIAHSLFVELIAEIGTIGALVVLALLWRTVRNLRQVIRMAGQQQQVAAAPRDEVALRCYADAVIGATIACLVNGVFLSLLYYSYFWLFTVLASAIWYVAQDKIGSSRPETGGQEPPRPSRLMAPVPAPRRHPRR